MLELQNNQKNAFLPITPERDLINKGKEYGGELPNSFPLPRDNCELTNHSPSDVTQISPFMSQLLQAQSYSDSKQTKMT